MIAPAFLRIGNILSVCYEEGLKPHKVEILQVDLVHLSGRNEADDPRDLIGLPVSKEFLLYNNFEELLMRHHFITRINKTFIMVEFVGEAGSLLLYVNKATYSFKYIHELQNILLYAAGWEMTYPFQNVLNP